MRDYAPPVNFSECLVRDGINGDGMLQCVVIDNKIVVKT